MNDESNPCVTCGACCARFRISFYSEDQSVPKELSYVSGEMERTLKSKLDSDGRPRCLSLRGEIGSSVACGIYDQRPQPCREFRYSYENGGPREKRCDEARVSIGLAPLEPQLNKRYLTL